MAETFDRVLKLTLSGAGPTDAFRPFLLTALRRVSYGQPRAKRLRMPANARIRPGRSMPERWIAVL